MRPVSIIVAMDMRSGISKDGKLPWKIKQDFNHFQKITTGHFCIMGRRTYEEISHIQHKRKNKKIKEQENQSTKTDINEINEILPGRESIVLTSDDNYMVKGATTSKGLRQAIEQKCTDESKQIFVLGGEKLFIEALVWASTVYLTFILDDYQCTKKFPYQYVDKHFRIVGGEKVCKTRDALNKKDVDLYFVKFERVKK